MESVLALIILTPFLIFICVPLLGILIASLAVTIHNVSEGQKRKWPARNIVGASISGTILTCVIAALVGCVMYFNNQFDALTASSSSSSIYHYNQVLDFIKNISIFY